MRTTSPRVCPGGAFCCCAGRGLVVCPWATKQEQAKTIAIEWLKRFMACASSFYLCQCPNPRDGSCQSKVATISGTTSEYLPQASGTNYLPALCVRSCLITSRTLSPSLAFG